MPRAAGEKKSSAFRCLGHRGLKSGHLSCSFVLPSWPSLRHAIRFPWSRMGSNKRGGWCLSSIVQRQRFLLCLLPLRNAHGADVDTFPAFGALSD